jgi:hypothetical protein
VGVGAHSREGSEGPWRKRARESVWDLSGLAVLPVIVAAGGFWSAVDYFAAAISGHADIAGNSNRWLSTLYGFACLVVAATTDTYIVVWLGRPARPSVLWPRLSKWFSGRPGEDD